MFKFTFSLLIFVAIGAVCSAQGIDTLLKNKRYCSINALNYVQEMRMAGDSMIVVYKKDSVIKGKDIYRVMHVVPRGDYTLLIVKMDPASMALITPRGKQKVNIPLYGVFVIRFEQEDNHLMVLHDGRLWLTEQEASATYAAIRLSGEYFNTWYAAGHFAKLVRYPSFNDADSLKVEKVALNWITKIAEHRAKKLNTYSTDKLGTDYARDNLTKVLVNNHLSPLATPDDFNRMLKKYHLFLLPANGLSPRDSTARRSPNAGKTISD